jgi:hypothetical protein
VTRTAPSASRMAAPNEAIRRGVDQGSHHGLTCPLQTSPDSM